MNSNTDFEKSNITVLGLWHQGIVAAACLADSGYKVLAADPNKEIISKLNQGKSPIFEPNLNELINKGLEKNLLTFTENYVDSVKGKKFIFLSLDTPVDENDQSDLQPIFQIVDEISESLEEDCIIIVTSQVPIGTCDSLVSLISQKTPSLNFDVVYIPENLRLGQAIERFIHPSLPVIGTNQQSSFDQISALLSPFESQWEHVSLRTAEMTKHALNSFLAVSICLGNQIGNLCDQLGADGKRVAEVLKREPRIGRYAMLSPGLGFAGGTLARDLQTLRNFGKQFNVKTPLLDGAWETNQIQNTIVVKKLEKIFHSLRGIKVCILGLTYKPGTSTLRRSPALEIITDLHLKGASITAHDPQVDKEELQNYTGFTFFDDPLEAVHQANVLILVTPWPEYKNLAFHEIEKQMADPILIDTNNFLDPQASTLQGFRYYGIGRGF